MSTDNARDKRHKRKEKSHDRHRVKYDKYDKYDKHAKKYDKYDKDEKRRHKDHDHNNDKHRSHKRKRIEYERADYSKSKDKYIPSDLSVSQDGANPRVYVSNLNPQKATIENVAELFGQIGRIKSDKRNHDQPKIKFYFNDKHEKSGDCTITYDDCHTAPFAITWFNNTEFLGTTIKVEMAAPPKTKEQYLAEKRGRGGFRGRGRGRGRGGGFRGGGHRGGFRGRGGGNYNGARGGFRPNNRSRSRSRSRERNRYNKN
eukprot:498074_1